MSAGTIIRDRKGHSIFLDDHVEVTVGARLEIRDGVVTGITRKNVTVSYTRSDGKGVTTGRFPVRTGAGASIVDGVIFKYSLTRDYDTVEVKTDFVTEVPEGWRYADGEEETEYALNGGGTYQLDAKGDILIPIGQVNAEALANVQALADKARDPWVDGNWEPGPVVCENHVTVDEAFGELAAKAWETHPNNPANFDVNVVSAIADVDIPKVFLRGFDEPISDSVRAILFGHLVKLATPLVESFHGDLYHDVHWVDKHVTGPICFFFGADECGTAIGTDSSLVRQSRRHVWQVQLTVESRGAWYVQIAKRYER